MISLRTKLIDVTMKETQMKEIVFHLKNCFMFYQILT